MDIDTVSIYRVSIPLSRMCSFIFSMDTSFRWKIAAVRAASTSVFSKKSKKYSTLKALPDAMAGMEILLFYYV